MSWPEFEAKLKELRPRFYLTQVTAPTLTNDMYGAFLARSLGAITMAFGTHVTPMPRETMEHFPALDFVLRGEPELTLRELLDTVMVVNGLWKRDDGQHGREGRWQAGGRRRPYGAHDERRRSDLGAGVEP